jgi:hypothetical protein
LGALAAQAGTGAFSGKEAFGILKTLAGEWQGTSSEAGKSLSVSVIYRVTSAGSAVLETLFPGTDHEMVTVYHLDKGKLVLTHYCAAGNQPRMALHKNSTPQDLVFEFKGGSNINPRKDMHMHAVRIRLESADHIIGEWTGFSGGKAMDATRFNLTRKS